MLKTRVRENGIERKFIISLSLNANKRVLQILLCLSLMHVT